MLNVKENVHKQLTIDASMSLESNVLHSLAGLWCPSPRPNGAAVVLHQVTNPREIKAYLWQERPMYNPGHHSEVPS